ncbi:MAG: DUF1801 domain-containing protein [Bacteroidota bacterium]
MIKPQSIDQYIWDFPEDVQGKLQAIRRLVHQFAPSAEETISYGIPTFKLSGKYLVHFAGYKKHIGMYPAPDANDKDFREDLAAYKTGKGTVQFPLNKELPVNLITRIIQYRIAWLQEEEGAAGQ